MSSALEKSHSWGVEDVCSHIRSAPSSDAYSAPPAICSMTAHTPFHCESWCLPLLQTHSRAPLLLPAPFLEALALQPSVPPVTLSKKENSCRVPYFPTAAMDRSLVPRSFIFFCGGKCVLSVLCASIFVRVRTPSTEF